jgi:hypothetical protein
VKRLNDWIIGDYRSDELGYGIVGIKSKSSRKGSLKACNDVGTVLSDLEENVDGDQKEAADLISQVQASALSHSPIRSLWFMAILPYKMFER